MLLPSDTRIYAFLVTMVAALGQSLSEAYVDSQNDDIALGATKRGWNMLRLGRGLQMLRLGKRNGLDNQAQANEAVPWERLSEEELRALISAFMEPRGQARRQPPLPRYGRQISNTARDLLEILTGDSTGNDAGSDAVIFRHPPRGGRRYKRSVPSPVGAEYYNPYEGYFLAQNGWAGRPYRAVALPRYGRQFSPRERLQTKAIPLPRIGRETSAKESSSDTASDPSKSTSKQ